MQNQTEAYIFISYKRGEGDEYVDRIEKELGGLHIPFWRDAKMIRYGKKWSPEIDDGIHKAIALIVIVTLGIVESQWITYEWARAMGQGIPVIPIKFVPMDDKELHDQLRALMYADYTKDGDQIWGKLLLEFETIIKDYPHIRVKWLLDQVKNSALPLEKRKEALHLLDEYNIKGVVDELLLILRDKTHEAIHPFVIGSLGTLGDPKAIMDLLEIVERGDTRTAHMATFALSRLGDASVAPSLMQYLKSNDNWVRRMAAESMGNLRFGEAVEELIEMMLYDTEWHVRSAAAEALGKIGDNKAVKPLTEAVEDIEVRTRIAAVEALGELRNPEGVSTLIKALKDTSFYWGNLRICDAAARSLRKIPSEEGRRAALIWERKQPRKKR